MDYGLIMVAAGLLLLFWLINCGRNIRYRQWGSVLGSIFIYFAGIYIYMDHYLLDSRLGGVLKEFNEGILNFPSFHAYIEELKGFLSTTSASADFIQNHQDKIALVTELFFLSFLGLLFFLLFKLLLILFCILKTWLFKQKNQLNVLTSVFYERIHGEIYLKKKYIFPGTIARYFGSFLLFVVIVLPIAGFDSYGEWMVEWFQPPFVLLSAMLLMEIGFFLGGRIYAGRYGAIASESTKTNIVSDFDTLYKQYHEALGERILSGHISKKENDAIHDFHGRSIPPLDISYFETSAIRMQKEGKEINLDYLLGLDTLFSWRQQGKKPNVLFSNAYDEQFEPYLKLFCEFSYLHNKKIIIPVLTPVEKDATIEWLDGVISSNVFDAKDCNFIDYKEKRDHILVDTLDAIIHDSTLEKYLSDFHFVVLFDLENYIRKNHLFLNTFLQLYKSFTAKTPQILGFSNIPNELEPSFNLIFVGANDDTTEIKIKKEEENAFFLLVFGSSGREFQELLDLDRGLYLGKEIPIAYFANNRAGISPIMISSKSSSLEEEFEELCKGVECSISLRESIQQVINHRYNHITKKHKFFIVDDDCNLPQTIQKWKNYAISDEIFLIVVSSPYLLRAYFVDNLPLLVEDNEFYTELLPKGGLSKHEKAFMLLLCLSLNRLKRDDVDLDDVSRESIANFISDNIEDIEMHPSEIHVSLSREFNGNDFEEQIYYSISPKNYSPKILYYTFETTQHEELGICLEDDLYHKYNKGMLLTISGRAYRIQEFNHRKRSIIVEFIPTTPIPYYHVDMDIVIHLDTSAETEVLFEKEKNGINFSASYFDLDYDCKFYGYHQVESAIKTKLSENVSHTYNGKQSLLLRFERPEDFSDSFRHTFEYLLGEVLKVYFPKHYHLLGIKESEENADTTVYELWILEMSKINYHLLSTIIEGKYFQKILMLMEDVILWSKEKSEELIYGAYSNDPSTMDFEGVQKFLSQYLFGKNDITINRKRGESRVQKRDEEPATVEATHYCDFCGSPLPFGQYERLSDGRERCTVCSQQTARKKHISPKTMLKECMIYLEKKYHISIDQGVDVEIVSSEELHSKIGEEPLITEKYDPRSMGIAVKEDERKYILIENEAPYFREMGVLIHELTHIWQFDNLDIDKITDREKVIEGHAMYVELEFLREKFGEQKMYIQTESERSDIYGNGYRALKGELVEEGVTNPFEYLVGKYGH